MNVQRIATLVIVAAAAISAPSAIAAEQKISGVSGFPKGTFWSANWERFVEAVNAEGKGVIQIDYKGGAPAIGSPFKLVQRVQKGIFGLVSITGAYYTNVLPEADAFKLSELTVLEFRKNGGFEYIDKLHQDVGLKYVGRHVEAVPFHLYTNVKLDKPDLTGLKIRSTPIYRNMFVALGASTLRSNIAQVYTYMENGTVKGFGWPIAGLLPDWHKVIKYRIDHPFYSAEIQILAHLGTWNKLGAPQKKFLLAMMDRFEQQNDRWADVVKESRALQDKQGIVPIKFSAEDEKKWYNTAFDAGWGGVIKVSPKHGPMLQKLLTRPR